MTTANLGNKNKSLKVISCISYIHGQVYILESIHLLS